MANNLPVRREDFNHNSLIGGNRAVLYITGDVPAISGFRNDVFIFYHKFQLTRDLSPVCSCGCPCDGMTAPFSNRPITVKV